MEKSPKACYDKHFPLFKKFKSTGIYQAKAIEKNMEKLIVALLKGFLSFF
jgi:hypothetical protein